MTGDDLVQVTHEPWLTFSPTDSRPTTGFIFYPGGRIDPRGYAPLLHTIAAEGYLVVSDQYRGGDGIGADYNVGPVWHLGVNEEQEFGSQSDNWFDAPALDHAWWQKESWRTRLVIHHEPGMRYGTIKQRVSQDLTPNVTSFAYRSVTPGETVSFVSVFHPYRAPFSSFEFGTHSDAQGCSAVPAPGLKIRIDFDGAWKVTRDQLGQ